MSSPVLRNRVEGSTKPNVFERLTMKKTADFDPMTKSTINTKHKPSVTSIPQTSRSNIGSRVAEKKQQKQFQKFILPLGNYSCLSYPVEYAQNGFIIELETQSYSNVCKINMNYNQYDVLVNEIQHHFTMPIMCMLIKTIKVILPQQWGQKFSIVLSRGKGKIRADKIQTSSFLSFVHTKDMIEIDPFKDIEEAQLRRKKMLLKEIPKIRLDKVYCRTEIDQVVEKQEEANQQYLLMSSKTIKTKKHDFYQQNTLGSPHRRMIKKDIFNLLTPRSKLLQSPVTDKRKYQQKINLMSSTNQDTMPEISMFEQTKTLKQKQKTTVKNIQVNQNIKTMSEIVRSKASLFGSPRRV